jgi:Ca2+-binding EF-hand superfamily protein
MKKFTLGISALALTLAGAAIAAQAPRMLGHDKNLTRAEAKTRAEEAFAKFDVNKDGKLDKADRGARQAAHFDKMDANHDGNLSRDEFTAAHEAMREGGREGGRDMPPPPPGGPMGMGPMEHGQGGPRAHDGKGPNGGPRGMHRGMPMMMEILAIADPARSGTVSKDAFVGAALKMFDQADANHDGTVTAQERKAAFAKKRGEMAANHGGHRGGGRDMAPPPPPPPAGK